jgi:hypothetical protein
VSGGQLRRGEVGWEGSGGRIRVARGTNRVGGVAVWASRRRAVKPVVVEGPLRRRGGCAGKVVVLIRGGLRWGSRAGQLRSRGRCWPCRCQRRRWCRRGSGGTPGGAERRAEARGARAGGSRHERGQPRVGPRREGRGWSPGAPVGSGAAPRRRARRCLAPPPRACGRVSFRVPTSRGRFDAWGGTPVLLASTGGVRISFGPGWVSGGRRSARSSRRASTGRRRSGGRRSPGPPAASGCWGCRRRWVG